MRLAKFDEFDIEWDTVSSEWVVILSARTKRTIIIKKERFPAKIYDFAMVEKEAQNLLESERWQKDV